jgi:hypothetical protein
LSEHRKNERQFPELSANRQRIVWTHEHFQAKWPLILVKETPPKNRWRHVAAAGKRDGYSSVPSFRAIDVFERDLLKRVPGCREY